MFDMFMHLGVLARAVTFLFLENLTNWRRSRLEGDALGVIGMLAVTYACCQNVESPASTSIRTSLGWGNQHPNAPNILEIRRVFPNSNT